MRVAETTTSADLAAHTTTYLNDPANPTGYTKAVEEHTGAAAAPSRSYVIGLKVEGQSTAATAAAVTTSTHYLLTDGHGTTRATVDLAGHLVQRLTFDAYLNLLNMPESDAITPWLAPDGVTDAAVGLRNNLSRWVNDARFISSDPLENSASDPRHLHKYTYTPGDPLNYVDAAGGDFINLGGLVTSIGIAAVNYGSRAISAARTYFAASRTIDTLFVALTVACGFLNPEKMGSELVFTFPFDKGIFRRGQGNEYPTIQLAISRNSSLDGIIQVRADWKNGARLRLNIDLNDKSRSNISGGWNLPILKTYPKIDLAFRVNTQGKVRIGFIVSLDAGFVPLLKDLKYGFPVLTYDRSNGFRIIGGEALHEFF